MAKSKFKTVSMTAEAVSERETKKLEKKAKKTASQTEESQIVEPEMVLEAESQTSSTPIVTPKKLARVRGKKYISARAQVDKTKIYSLKEGIDLLKKTKFTKFDESVEIHLSLSEIISTLEVSYPHSIGKTIRVSILDEDVIAKLEKGEIDFDVLLATPSQMGKITKFARLLGPKGLMPNPKNGTLLADPVKRKIELEAGKTTVRGEKKAPLLHTTIGKISLPTKELQENIEALFAAFPPGKLQKATLCTSMSPGIKVAIQ